MAINVGPGSFTGVRIGVAALKGIDFDGGEDCIEVSTLHSMAYNYCGVKDVIVCSVMDARCQQVYTANFDVCGDKVTRMTEDKAISIEALVNELQSCEKPVVFVGDGASLCYNYVNQFKEELLTNVSLAPQQLRFQNAVATAMCAQHMLDEGYAPVSADKVLPIYLRAPQAERELKKNKLRRTSMLAIGCDHGGYELKNSILKHLEEKGVEYKDFGTYSTDSVDYPDIAETVCAAVTAGEADLAILVCGTGIGMSMAANKVKGIRAACCSDTFSAKFTRLHNDANCLCLGGRVVGPGLADMLVDAFIDTEFEGGRHQRRIDKVMAIENK